MPYLTLIRWGFALAMAALVCGGLVKCGYERGVSAGEAKVRESDLKNAKRDLKSSQDSQRAAEANAAHYRQRAEAQEVIAEQYLQGLNDANRKGDKLAADLIAGRQRFNRMWSQCQAVPAAGSAAASAGTPDGATDDRAESAGRIVRAAAECDAQVRGLQALIIEERRDGKADQ